MMRVKTKLIYLATIVFALFAAILVKDMNLELANSFRPIRWGAIAIFIYIYPFLVDQVAKSKNLSEEQIIEAKSKQTKVGVLLVAFELLVVENVLGGIL